MNSNRTNNIKVIKWKMEKTKKYKNYKNNIEQKLKRRQAFQLISRFSGSKLASIPGTTFKVISFLHFHF